MQVDNVKDITELENALKEQEHLGTVGEAYNYLINLPQWKLVMEQEVFTEVVNRYAQTLTGTEEVRTQAVNILTGLAATKKYLASMEDLVATTQAKKDEIQKQLTLLRGTM